MTDALMQPVTILKGVGEQLTAQLAKSGLHSLQDLLLHCPYRYQDRTRITPIDSLRVGDYAVIEATILTAKLKYGRRSSLLCTLSDGSGCTVVLRFFYFNASQKAHLKSGARIRCFGEVRIYGKQFEMVHPEYRILYDESIIPIEDHLTPIYPKISGLTQWRLTELVKQALALLEQASHSVECLPKALLTNDQWPTFEEAIRYIHQPPPDAALDRLADGQHVSQQRLAFEELLAHQLCLRQLRAKAKQLPAPAFSEPTELIGSFEKKLSFHLTDAQKRVYRAILHDLEQPHPMQRLLQGDVGSGKTVVAVLSSLVVLNKAYQVAFMVPTELLAEQHSQTLTRWLDPFNIRVDLLTGQMKAKEKRRVLEAIELGNTHIVVGTHALFQQAIQFKQLGLIVIDEQHRFGVQQRLALLAKGKAFRPHQLMMTATPIPRTITMTAYADVDVSVIDELPKERKPVTTVVIPNTKRKNVIQRIREACQQNHQVYWVCTLIEDSEVLRAQAAEETFTDLQTALPNLNIGLLHGRLSSQEKEKIMHAFKQGDLSLLVATTVIEVGVDVPNASVMIIENPERLGLAQLHQLRGRVGRGAAKSYCVLLYQAPLSETAQQRLSIIRESNDGFVIANKDLEIRGPGEVLGTRQSGLQQCKIANILRDRALLPKVREAARYIEQHHPDIIPKLLQRWLPQGQELATV